MLELVNKKISYNIILQNSKRVNENGNFHNAVNLNCSYFFTCKKLSYMITFILVGEVEHEYKTRK